MSNKIQSENPLQRVEFSEVTTFLKHSANIAIAVIPKGIDGYNLITLEWFMRTSIKPPMIAVSIGQSRYSYGCFQQADCFNLSIPSLEMKEGTKICGSLSGKEIDKFALTGFEGFPGRLARIPVLRESLALFECKIVTQVRTGDHTIFVGEVKHSYLNKEKKLLTYKEFSS